MHVMSKFCLAFFVVEALQALEHLNARDALNHRVLALSAESFMSSFQLVLGILALQVPALVTK